MYIYINIKIFHSAVLANGTVFCENTASCYTCNGNGVKQCESGEIVTFNEGCPGENSDMCNPSTRKKKIFFRRRVGIVLSFFFLHKIIRTQVRKKSAIFSAQKNFFCFFFCV